MINMHRCISPHLNLKTKVVSMLGGFFTLDRTDLLLSLPANLRSIASNAMGGRGVLVRDQAKRTCLYDWESEIEIGPVDEDEYFSALLDAEDGCQIKKLDNGDTQVYLESNKFVIPKKAGNYFASTDDLVFFKIRRESKVTCFSCENGMQLWELVTEGKPRDLMDGSILLHDVSSISKFTLIDSQKGTVIFDVHLNFRAHWGITIKNKLYAAGSTDDESFMYEFDLSTGEYRTFAPRSNNQYNNSGSVSYYADDHCYIVYNSPETQPVCEPYSIPPISERKVVIERYQLPDMVLKGSVEFEYLNSINLIGKDPDTNRYYGIGVSKDKKIDQKNYLIEWEESDYLAESSQAIVEGLDVDIVKEEEGGFSVYSISTKQNSSFFHVYRQLSLGIYTLVMRTARTTDSEMCQYDEAFGGVVYCDVSKMELEKKEKVAISNMCQHLEVEFADYASFDREKWISKEIKVIPQFSS